jgi:hypothetical protein
VLIVAAIRWRRLDAAGEDRCRLRHDDVGWTLEGTAVFDHDGQPADLTYRVSCGPEWITTAGAVAGVIGERAIDLRIKRSDDGVWSMQGVPAPGVAGCADLDFGFTPATNLFQLRRLALVVGAAEVAPVAWLDIDSGELNRLHQRYERRTVDSYWYEAPQFEYAAQLEVTPAGFIRRYPGLWEMEIG